MCRPVKRAGTIPVLAASTVASALVDLLDRDHSFERARRSAGTVRDVALEGVAAGLQFEVDDL